MREEAVEIINKLVEKLTYHRIILDYDMIERIQNFIAESKEKE